MRVTFCALSYEPCVELLNNGNAVGLRFGFRAVSTSDHMSQVRIPLEERFFPNLDGTSLHRDFRVRRIRIFCKVQI